MLTKSTFLACKESGMPVLHAACFQSVANKTNCVIASRSVGKYATSLILEGYESKGFHVKAKSCNWGPMAGFVLSDPRFTKTGSDLNSMSGQAGAVHKDKKGGATETPLFISNDRLLELEAKKWVTRDGGNINEKVYSASSSGKNAVPMKFVLRREFDVPGANGKVLWSVHYGPGETVLPSMSFSREGALKPVMALVNPGSTSGNYKAAITGDYDLWAVFPPANHSFSEKATAVQKSKFQSGGSSFGTKGLDTRLVTNSDRFSLPIEKYIQQEDPHLGNVTPRIIEIRDLLNGAINASGYTGGNMVHHSDEVGRPKVNEVELQYIAFIPGHSEARFVNTLQDMKEFISEVAIGYHLTFNPGWQRQLGFTTSAGGSYIV
jgi:hypothetical protein